MLKGLTGVGGDRTLDFIPLSLSWSGDVCGLVRSRDVSKLEARTGEFDGD